MTLNIKEGLPVIEKLRTEDVKVNPIRSEEESTEKSVKIGILNLMPKKEQTELQLLRLIGYSPLDIEVDFLHTASYASKNVSPEYLDAYYKTFDEVKDSYYDGFIITGAPIEHFAFEEVAYYDELVEILEWSETHVNQRWFICWGAQFALNHYYGIEKETLDQKLFGIYEYQTLDTTHPYLKGFDDFYRVPQSRHTQMDEEQIHAVPSLNILTRNEDHGPDIIVDEKNKDLFVFGHLEYDRDTLEQEYHRDLDKGLEIEAPENYYPNDDPAERPLLSWRSHSYLLAKNWLLSLCLLKTGEDAADKYINFKFTTIH